MDQEDAGIDEETPSAAAGFLLPPELLLKIIKVLDADADRWQAAAGLALAGAFGNAWRAHLEPFWLEEAQAKRPGVEIIKGPYETLSELQVAATHMGEMQRWVLPHRRVVAALEAEGLGEYKDHETVEAHVYTGAPTQQQLIELLYRERELTAALDQHGLDIEHDPEMCLDYIYTGVGSVDEIVGRLRRHKELTAALEEHGLDLDDAPELCYAYIEDGVGSVDGIVGRILRQMDLYEALDECGLDADADPDLCNAYIADGVGTVEHVVQVLLNRLYRRGELTAALAARGLPLRSDSALCAAYISTGDGDVPRIVDTMHEMAWYFKYTKYREIRVMLEKGPLAGEAPGVVGQVAKDAAWSYVVQKMGNDWLLALSDMPPTLRHRLEAE